MMVPVFIEGKKYATANEAAKALKIPVYSVIARVKSPRECWKDWTNEAPRKKRTKKVKDVDGKAV